MGNVIKIKTELAICTKCTHFLNKEPNSVRREVWYNHLCKAAPLPVKQDPYDGKMKAYSANDFGQGYFTDDKYKYCRDINPDGKCSKR